jgi:MoaA/NifB/PqqE/SkfB family radical SAM enzyme
MCYSFKSLHVSSLATKCEILDRIANAGATKVMLTGGEPLIYKDLLLVARHAKARSLKVGLSTNAILLTPQWLNEACSFVDEISLPLDGSTSSIHALGRGSRNHFELVLERLELLRPYPFAIDVGTIVSAVNWQSLDSLAELLIRHEVRKWKLFQFWPIAKAHALRGQFALPVSHFRSVADSLMGKYGVEISIDARDALLGTMQSYVDISANGDVVLPKEHGYRIIGNVLTCKDLIKMLENNSFNFAVHHSRHWRDKNYPCIDLRDQTSLSIQSSRIRSIS